MKKLFTSMLALAALTSVVSAQGMKKPASPHEMASETLRSGVTVTIHYGSPSVKGRTIGKDLEPMAGKVWRAGADSATTFTVDKNVKIDGHALSAGKYALFTIDNGSDWTIIFNKEWATWGAFSYEKNKGSDALQVHVKPRDGAFTEKLLFSIDKSGDVTLHWGARTVSFTVTKG